MKAVMELDFYKQVFDINPQDLVSLIWLKLPKYGILTSMSIYNGKRDIKEISHINNFIEYNDELENFVLDYTPLDTNRGLILQKILTEGKNSILFCVDIELIKRKSNKSVATITNCDLYIDEEELLTTSIC